MVGGSNNDTRSSMSAGYARRTPASNRPAISDSAGKKRSKSKAVAVHGTKEVKPEQVIPMDDEDFRDF